MTKSNLIHDPWLPVQDLDGNLTHITPAQVATGSGKRYRRLVSPRPDFDGALLQFLIGLLQTTFAPIDEKSWKDRWDHPPTADELNEAFKSYVDAFHLGGDGPRFMQDLTLRDGETKPIAALLLDAPGGNTVRNNQDHFIKRDNVARLCPRCAAAALFCLQTNAPSGGQGHRVGLRGGGPLTTLLVPKADSDTGLWHTLWLNVLPQGQFQAKDGQTDRRAIFPWLAETRTSEKNQKVTPQVAHPLQMFWGMPRRIRLDTDNAVEGSCDLCGVESVELLTHYATRNFGISYDGWQHVLTPHSREAADKPHLPAHGQPGGIGFRHWAGLVVADEEGKGKGRFPAKVVSHAKQAMSRRRIAADVFAFGYDMDNMKARAWVESRLPLLLADEARQEAFEETSRYLVHAANEAFVYLRSMVKSALFGEPLDNQGKLKWDFPPSAKIDTAFFENLAGDFWRQGEAPFFVRLRELQSSLEDPQLLGACKEAWLRNLADLAMKLFDQAVGGVEEADSRVKAVVYARRQLGGMLHGNALRKLIDLPEHLGKQTKGGKRG